MSNENGSVLVIVLGFVLSFSMLGVGSIHHSYVQSDIAEKEKASAESFWIADGKIEEAAYKLSVSLTNYLNETSTVGRVNYNVVTAPICICDYDQPTCNEANCTNANGYVSGENRKIRSNGVVNVPYSNGAVNNQFRGIEAKFGSFDVENAITTHGLINDGSCTVTPGAQLNGNCVQNAEFTFESVFNGMTMTEFIALAAATPAVNPLIVGGSHEIHITNAGDPFEIGGATILFIEGNIQNFVINTDDEDIILGPTVLVVDTTGYTGNPSQPPSLKINGDAGLCGIVWVIGEAKINGNGLTEGAIFIDGDENVSTFEGASSIVTYHGQCIADAIGSIGGTGPPNLYAWKEYSL